MKNITRSELEAIGENWYQRRNRLLDFFEDETKPKEDRHRAWMLAFTMNARLTKIILILGQRKAPKNFKPGGIVLGT